MIHRFTDEGRVGGMDALYSQWATRKDQGFSAEDITALRLLLPSLALAVKCASCVRIIGTLADVYLGHDAGQKVVSGQITRGAADKVEASGTTPAYPTPPSRRKSYRFSTITPSW